MVGTRECLLPGRRHSVLLPGGQYLYEATRLTNYPLQLPHMDSRYIKQYRRALEERGLPPIQME